MHRFPRLPGLHDQARVGTQPFRCQGAVHHGTGQQAGNGKVAAANVAVRQRQDAHAGPDQPYGGLRQVVQGGPQYLPVPAFRKLDGKPGGRESGLPDIAETVELLIRDDGALHLDQPGVFRRFFQNIGMVADVRGQAHDQFLPDGVDGRVGHLREQLLEIIEQKGGLPGKDGQRGVVPHGAERFRPLHHHGAYDQFHVLLRESEPALVRRQVRHFRGSGNGIEQGTDGNLVLFHPAAVGHPPGHLVLGLRVGHQPVVHQVAVNHLTGAQTPPAAHFLRGNVRHARFRGQNENIVRGQRVPGGTQPVAIQHGPRVDAVGKNDGGRAVPRLHHRGMVFKKAAHVRPQMIVGAPGLRHEHQHHVAQVAPGGHQQLHHVVQAGGITLAGGNMGQELPEVLPQQGGG